MASLVKQPSLFPILLVNFVGTLGFSIVLPFLIFLVMKFGGDAVIYGLLAATYPAFQLIGAPLLGRWSDIYGRKKILLLSHAGTLAGWMIFFISLFLPVNNLFNIDATIIGTFYGEVLPVLAALILSLVVLVVIVFVLKETKCSILMKIPEKNDVGRVFSFESKECYKTANPQKLKFRDIFKLKHISFLVVLYFLIFLGFNIFYTSFPIHAVNDLGWTVTQLGIFYAVLSGIMVLVQGPILRKALKKFSEEQLVIIGSVILGTNFILFVSPDIILIYGAAVLFAVGNGLMWPSVISSMKKLCKTYWASINGI